LLATVGLEPADDAEDVEDEAGADDVDDTGESLFVSVNSASIASDFESLFFAAARFGFSLGTGGGGGAVKT
jgi:hypothetical protein